MRHALCFATRHYFDVVNTLICWQPGSRAVLEPTDGTRSDDARVFNVRLLEDLADCAILVSGFDFGVQQDIMSFC